MQMIYYCRQIDKYEYKNNYFQISNKLKNLKIQLNYFTKQLNTKVPHSEYLESFIQGFL
jgi:hypothetical protein